MKIATLPAVLFAALFIFSPNHAAQRDAKQCVLASQGMHRPSAVCGQQVELAWCYRRNERNYRMSVCGTDVARDPKADAARKEPVKTRS